MNESPFSRVAKPLKMQGAENRAFRRPLADNAQGWGCQQFECRRAKATSKLPPRPPLCYTALKTTSENAVSEKIGWSLALVLVLVCGALSLHLIGAAGRSARVPVFMPLVTDSGEPNQPPPPGEAEPPTPPEPADLELAGVETMTILGQAGRLGPTVSLEDLVRGLLFLEEQGGELALSPAQKKALAPLVEQAFAHRRELLETQEEIRALEKRLPQQAAQAMRVLTDDQARRLREGRDVISLAQFEDPYWQELLGKLRETE
jgi:hypothetical protein